MKNYFETKDEHASSSHVESYFSKVKNTILDNGSRSRPDVFFAKHSNQIDVEMKLAIGKLNSMPSIRKKRNLNSNAKELREKENWRGCADETLEQISFNHSEELVDNKSSEKENSDIPMNVSEIVSGANLNIQQRELYALDHSYSSADGSREIDHSNVIASTSLNVSSGNNNDVSYQVINEESKKKEDKVFQLSQDLK